MYQLPTSDDRPRWAAQLRLPSYEQLRYSQTLLLTVALGFLALYLVTRTAEDPGALVRAARKKVGA